MEQKAFLEMVDRYLSGKASQQEQNLLEEYYSRMEAGNSNDIDTADEAILGHDMYQQIRSRIGAGEVPVVKMKTRRILRMVAVAAAVVILAAIYFVFTVRDADKEEQVAVAPKAGSIPLQPGRDAAILTMTNGQSIRLDTASGAIKKGNGATITNLNGQLSYSGSSSAGTVEYHTISTARGNQYQLVLADGSKVFLNSASSLHFPSAFTGSIREVELTSGEAYFDITTNPAQPFHVKTREMTIEVTGTHFNVNAYSDEGPVATTLVEGKIKVVRGHSVK